MIILCQAIDSSDKQPVKMAIPFLLCRRGKGKWEVTKSSESLTLSSE